MAEEVRRGTGDLDAPAFSRVVIKATGEFICVGMSDDRDHTIRVYGPAHSGARWLDFMPGGEPLRVVCASPKVEWQVEVRTRADRNEKLDPVPKEMPLRYLRPPTQSQLIRAELANMLRMREEAGMATSFAEEDDFDAPDTEDASDPLSSYELRELGVDEELELRGIDDDSNYTANIERAEREARESGGGAGRAPSDDQSSPEDDEGDSGPAEGASQSSGKETRGKSARNKVRAESRPVLGKAR